VSSLHKQNFDLKLELYHRRTRQSEMEEEIAALKAKNTEMEEMHDNLFAELERKDKAIEEAVAMILRLETQVEMLMEEREMVRQVEASGFFARQHDLTDAALDMATPKPKLAGGDVKVITHMPSFLSDFSENTENLRNAYLGVRGSLLSLPRSELHADAETANANGLASPSLSVLSESSFLSVYGTQDSNTMGLGSVDEPLTLDGMLSDPSPPPRRESIDVERLPKDMIVTPTRLPRSNSITRPPGPGQFHSITDIIDQGSPLQQLERLERTFSLKANGSPPRPERDIDTTRTKSLSQRKTKEEKREALRRVLTDAPPTKLHHDQALPPTPDTISTSTLRRYKNSNDTLSHQQDITNQRSYLNLSETTSSVTQAGDSLDDMISQPPSMSAFNSGKKLPKSDYLDSRLPIIQRPRSADETTISHKRGNTWDSDNESTHSLESSLDIWLQQGKEASRAWRGGRGSPDLFSFPAGGSNGWTTDAMFGSSSGHFSPTTAADTSFTRSHAIDDLLPVQEALFATGRPPPTPNRRSSLHARTGSSSVSGASTPRHPAPVNGKLRKSPVRNGHSRHNSDETQSRPSSQATTGQPTQQPASTEKQSPRPRDNHYPPIAGQAARPRGRGLNNLFRRSLGGGSGVIESAPASATEPNFPAAASSPISKERDVASQAIGMPSWIHRSSVVDDDRASATPPPILRNRMPGRSNTMDGEVSAPGEWDSMDSPTTPIAPVAPTMAASTNQLPAPPGPNSAVPNSGPGPTLNKRKWLPGFGRTSSLRNRVA
jgi:hypothetical protein